MNWIIYALISAFLVSIATVLQKRALQTDHTTQFSATLAFVNLIICIPLFFVIDYGSLTTSTLFSLFIASLLGGGGVLYSTKALRHMGISEVSPLFVLGPGLTAIVAFLFLGEGLTALQIIGIIVTLLGAYLLELRSHDLLSPFKTVKSSKYIHYLLLSLLLYAGSAVIGRSLLSTHHVQPEAFLAFAHFFLAIVFLGIYFHKYDGWQGISSVMRSHGWIIVVISILMVGHRYAEIYSVKLAYVGLVAVVQRSSALFTTVIGGRIFKEKHLVLKAAACVIMIIGILLIT